MDHLLVEPGRRVLPPSGEFRLRVARLHSRSPTGGAIEVSPVITSDGASILCLGSSATTPLMPYEITEYGRQMDEVMEGAAGKISRAEKLVTPQQVVIYKSEDGFTIHGQLFLPKDAAGKELPALVFIHGGPNRQMSLGFHSLDYYHNTYVVEPIPRQSWICGALSELSLGHHVRASAISENCRIPSGGAPLNIRTS